jgi:hypothetical protein
MSISVSIDSREVQAMLARLAEAAPQALAQEVTKSTLAIHAKAREGAAVDTGILRAGIEFVVINQGATGEVRVQGEYGPYIEFGTRPHFPPVAPLEEWARRHGLPPGTGFLIARKISRVGTPARPFLFPAYEAEAPEFEANCIVALQRAVGEAAV